MIMSFVLLMKGFLTDLKHQIIEMFFSLREIFRKMDLWKVVHTVVEDRIRSVQRDNSMQRNGMLILRVHLIWQMGRK